MYVSGNGKLEKINSKSMLSKHLLSVATILATRALLSPLLSEYILFKEIHF
jgi:hypothetical protein